LFSGINGRSDLMLEEGVVENLIGIYGGLIKEIEGRELVEKIDDRSRTQSQKNTL
jgi:hypothetical protein